MGVVRDTREAVVRGLRARWPRRGHPDPVVLSRYLDDELPDREREELEGHLLECTGCRRLLASLARTIRALGSLAEPVATARAEAIIAALPATPGPPAASWPRAAARFCLQRTQLRFTAPIAVLVGTALSLLNQGGMLLSGRIDVAMCVVCGLDYLLPFLAVNVALLTAARMASGRWARAVRR